MEGGEPSNGYGERAAIHAEGAAVHAEGAAGAEGGEAEDLGGAGGRGAGDGAEGATAAGGDMVAIKELVEECRKAVVAPNTASGYRGPQGDFIMWLQKEAPDICSPGFGAVHAGGRVHKIQVKKLVTQADVNNPPLDFSKLTAKHVITWMLKKGDSQQYGKGSFGNWRYVLPS